MTRSGSINFALLTVLFAGLFATALAQTLTVKDSENPETLVNTDTNTTLRLKVIVPDQPLVAGTNCEIRVEIHNTGFRVEVIYMPALTTRPAFHPDKTSGVVDEFGPPMVFGRMSAKEETLNYVVLMGGDYYGRTYRWTPPASGVVTVHASYNNKHAGLSRKLPAWRGELRAESAPLRVVKK
jgi:hypothetical protein